VSFKQNKPKLFFIYEAKTFVRTQTGFLFTKSLSFTKKK